MRLPALRTIARSRRRTSAHDAQAWIVFLGSGPGQDTLAVAAVTGSREEAEAFLDRGLMDLPGRSNEWGTYPYTPKGVEPAIRPGEQRTVHVVVAEDWAEVFETRGDAEQECRELVARGSSEARLIEVVTNTWVDADAAGCRPSS